MIKQKNDPLVSICCVTFNHENYIRNTIEGFLIQEVEFPTEIIIHDDASTDRTAEIVKKFAKKYPELIKPIFQEQNQWSKGRSPSPNFVWPKARGKYIALCEGDDYWTDPTKLQKQVDFLESNEDFVVTHHDAEVIDETGKIIKSSHYGETKNKIYEQSELLNGVGLVTCSMVFRNIFSENEIPNEFQYAFGGDRFLVSILGIYGKAYLMDDIKKAKYRIHQGGIDGNFTIDNKLSNELKQMENYLTTRIAIYLFLKRKGKQERYDILLNEILPKLLQLFKKKNGSSYFIEKVKEKLNFF